MTGDACWALVIIFSVAIFIDLWYNPPSDDDNFAT
jgi:hypothetical protein